MDGISSLTHHKEKPRIVPASQLRRQKDIWLLTVDGLVGLIPIIPHFHDRKFGHILLPCYHDNDCSRLYAKQLKTIIHLLLLRYVGF